jgi:pimeloyl-ACP methyl ester carboxylesterase
VTEPRFVEIAGRRIEYRFLPQANAPTLVFLHQGLGSAGLWRDFPDRLAARTGCGLLVYSRLGHGFSDLEPGPRRPDFLLHQGQADFRALLAALGIGEIIPIGHSDGATIALTYLAAGHPAFGAIVAAPHVFDEEITWRAIVRQHAAWKDGVLRGRLARHHRDVDATFAAWSGMWLAPTFRGWSIVPALAAIGCPLLAVQGVDDEYGMMAQIDAIALHSGGPVQVEKLEQCGHDPFRDRPDRMLDLSAEFIAGLA